MSRRDARRHALHLIFQFPFYGDWGIEGLAQAKAHYYDGLEPAERPNSRDAAYITRATVGTLDRCDQLDGVIENFLKDWDLTRINRVDLAIMRLAIYEMLCEPDVPLGTAVNEAVEMAKDYGGDDSPAFVNGVLANVVREINKSGERNGTLAYGQ